MPGNVNVLAAIPGNCHVIFVSDNLLLVKSVLLKNSHFYTFSCEALIVGLLLRGPVRGEFWRSFDSTNGGVTATGTSALGLSLPTRFRVIMSAAHPSSAFCLFFASCVFFQFGLVVPQLLGLARVQRLWGRGRRTHGKIKAELGLTGG
jgi:hypothetical protein